MFYREIERDDLKFSGNEFHWRTDEGEKELKYTAVRQYGTIKLCLDWFLRILG